MALYTGDTFTVQATLDASLDTPDSQVIRFYDGGGNLKGRYTSPSGSGVVFVQAHNSSEIDIPGQWLCHWQVTKGGVTESEELEFTVSE